jgi:hypothetical protein
MEWVERERAVASGEVAAGEYLVSYLITPADDYYYLDDSVAKLPAHHTTVQPGSAHVAVVIRDAADGRMIEGLRVRATMESSDAERAKISELPFGWHPILNRYGENMVLPRAPFTLVVRIAKPEYARHDSVNGYRFTRDVIARFEDVNVSRDSLAGAAQRAAHGDGSLALALSRKEGAAFASAIEAAIRRKGRSGYHQRAGDYDVALIVSPATGSWNMRDGKLVYLAPDSSAAIHHIDVTIRDGATGRSVPGLNVRVTLLNSRKREAGTFVLPFMWHPWMNHYGANVAVPASGRYTIRVRADAPAYRRYGAGALKQFNRALDVDVRNVRLASPVRESSPRKDGAAAGLN